MIQQVERLYFNSDAVPLGEVKRSGYSQVDLIDPGSIERIQVQRRTRTVAARDPSRSVTRRLIQGAVIESVTTAAGAGIYACTSGIQQACVWPTGVELHNRADRPVGE